LVPLIFRFFKKHCEKIPLSIKGLDSSRQRYVAGGTGNIEDEDLIPEENLIITLTHNGYINKYSN